MRDLVQKVDSVESKVLKLLQKNETLKAEKTALKERLNGQQNEIKDLKNKLETLLADNKNLKNINALLGSDEHKRETKFKINSLIREIDKCISHLSV